MKWSHAKVVCIWSKNNFILGDEKKSRYRIVSRVVICLILAAEILYATNALLSSPVLNFKLLLEAKGLVRI